MKRKILLIPILFSPLILSSCSFANIVPINSIYSLEIQDANSNYAVGDIYANVNQLSINATYRSGKVEEINIENATLSLAVDGVAQAYDSPLTSQGGNNKFTIQVSYNEVKSNILTYTLIENHIYPTSIEISGDTEIETFKEVTLNLIITPANYTCPLKVASSVPTSTDITLENNSLKVIAKKPGDVDITVSAFNRDINQNVAGTHHLSITAKTPLVTAAQTYNDYVKENVYPISACPSEGSPKLLVIPVWFTDSNNYITESNKETVRQDIENAYFGSKSDTGWHSVSSYYEEDSQGKLTLTGTVANWYECGISSKTAGVNDFDTDKIVEDAVDWFFKTNTSEKKSDYDLDGDNYLDGVLLIYAAPDVQQSGFGAYGNLWAYCYWIQKPSESGICANVYFWASYDFMYGSNTALTHTGKTYHNGDTAHCKIDAHTYIHEMGHVLGLDDYYDYSTLGYFPAGGFSMQDYNVGGHDPFSLFALGWAGAYIPSFSDTITISSFQESHDLILLTPEWNEFDSPFDEYLLLELYTPTGLNKFDTDYCYGSTYPQGAKKAGIRLWHVDARLATPKDARGETFTLLKSADVFSTKYGVTHANSNTYNDSTSDLEGYLSVLGRDYYDYNILQLIRNDRYIGYKTDETLVNSDLFYEGDSFSISTFSSQFKKRTTLNSGVKLGWTFTVENISLLGEQYTATIQVTKS